MKKINFSLVIATAYIAYIVGLTASKTGTSVTTVLVYNWYDPFLIGIVFIVPFLLGWGTHKEYTED